MIKVVKFGGSSLADASQFKKVADIVKAEKERKYVVPSAPGKRFKEDTKVTDMLYECYSLASTGKSFDELFTKIRERYQQIIDELSLDVSLDEEFAKIRSAFVSKAGRDYAASRGEYLNGILLAAYLGFPFIDAAEVIFFKNDGSFDSEYTNDVLSKKLKEYEYAVIPGFYGSMPNDTIKTFSRGGSDITGSIVSRAAMADLYENWTDVSGFLMADPRIVDSPMTIDTITYRELRELSYMGAGVLHEDAIFPVRLCGIPINIRNTNDPSARGTFIVAEAPTDRENTHNITGIAGKKGFCIISIEKDMMNQELGFGRRVLKVLEDNGISFEHLPSGIDTMCVVVNQLAIDGLEKKIIDELSRAVAPDKIEITRDVALIAVVGRGMKSRKGTAAKILTAVAESDVNIRMIDQGSSELNVILGIQQEDFEKALNAIYKKFVK
ncbi:MAG: aspartate kinase [Ruminococcaceae bacterium]|nr:aspartate kinase [Oscillospiraceae bacterium]